MRTTWSFHSAGSLVFGRNAVAQLGDVAHRLPARRVFVVTDAKLEKAGAVAKVVGPLREGGATVEVFAGGQPEPSLRLVSECTAVARGYGPDAILGLGGGSNMDVAKMAALLLTHGGEARDYLGDDHVPGPILPVICVPTTAGTGSEVSAAAALTDTDNALKVGCLSNYLRPRVAIVDPLLTVSCPPKVTADSGIDALTHAIEAYTAVDYSAFPLPSGERSVYQGRHPIGDACAETAIRLIGRHLRRAVKHGDDLEAREGMALGATIAGLSFSNVGVALVHALEYPVGGAVHCSHGEGNGLLLPHVMRFNLPARRGEFARIAEWLGEDVRGLSEDAAAERAVAAVDRLRGDIGVPGRLQELGVRAEQLAGFAAKTVTIQRMLRVNPRSATAADCEAIYRAAL
ncbi:MAG TPA: iron-containing alcohol dehydrogenase [Gemmataceae bacterium]|jgi:alcohol dehydrogenase class IV